MYVIQFMLYQFIFRFQYSALFLIICSVCFQSCCIGVQCGPCIGNAADIQIILNTDSTKSNSYKILELEGTAFLQIDTILNKTDTLEKITDVQGRNYNTFLYFRIHNPEVSNYSNPNIYKLINDSLKLNVLIDKISIKGYKKSGCCTCYRMDEVEFRVNNVLCNNSNFVINKP